MNVDTTRKSGWVATSNTLGNLELLNEHIRSDVTEIIALLQNIHKQNSAYHHTLNMDAYEKVERLKDSLLSHLDFYLKELQDQQQLVKTYAIPFSYKSPSANQSAKEDWNEDLTWIKDSYFDWRHPGSWIISGMMGTIFGTWHLFARLPGTHIKKSLGDLSGKLLTYNVDRLKNKLIFPDQPTVYKAVFNKNSFEDPILIINYLKQALEVPEWLNHVLKIKHKREQLRENVAQTMIKVVNKGLAQEDEKFRLVELNKENFENALEYVGQKTKTSLGMLAKEGNELIRDEVTFIENERVIIGKLRKVLSGSFSERLSETLLAHRKLHKEHVAEQRKKIGSHAFEVIHHDVKEVYFYAEKTTKLLNELQNYFTVHGQEYDLYTTLFHKHSFVKLPIAPEQIMDCSGFLLERWEDLKHKRAATPNFEEQYALLLKATQQFSETLDRTLALYTEYLEIKMNKFREVTKIAKVDVKCQKYLRQLWSATEKLKRSRKPRNITKFEQLEEHLQTEIRGVLDNVSRGKAGNKLYHIWQPTGDSAKLLEEFTSLKNAHARLSNQ